VIPSGVPISSSPDGITWISGSGIPSNEDIFDINSNSTILAAASSGVNNYFVYTSIGGQVWAGKSIPVGTNISYTNSVVWDGTNTWLITTATTTFQGGIFTSSDDFATLEDRGNTNTQSMFQLNKSVFDGTQWTVGGLQNVLTDGCILYSTMASDTSWTPTGWIWTFATGDVFDGFGGSCNDMAYSGSVYVAVGRSADGLYSISRSTNGRIWTRANNTVGVTGTNVTWATDRFVAIVQDFSVGGPVTPKWSYDGTTWYNSTGTQLPESLSRRYGLSRNQRIGT